MSFDTWISFFILCWGMSASPGPAQLASISWSLACGWKRCIPQAFGLGCGVFVLVMIVGLGIGAVLAASPKLFALIRGAGCAYLVWIGITQLRSKAGAVVMPENGTMVPTAESAPWKMWWRGFLVNVSNPKGLVFFLSLLTPFLNQASPVLPQYAIMGLTCCFTDFVIMNVVAYLAWELSKKLRSARTMRVLNRIFGVIFILIGVGLFFFNV